MKHLKGFNLNESDGKYYNIIDIKDALESISSNADTYFIVSTDDNGIDLDYTESYDELKFEALPSEDKDDYDVEMDTNEIFKDMFYSLEPSDQSPFFTENEIYRAIEDAIVKNKNGYNFFKNIDASSCSIDWHVVRGSNSYREFRVQATLEGKPEVYGCDWDSFVENVMKELGSRTAGRIDYA